MVNTKTDPVAVNPPSVGGWTVLYTRKVAAGTASDGDYVDTGIVYDPAYEYVVFYSDETSPTPTPTASATLEVCSIAATYVAKYEPDGSTVLGTTNKNSVFIPSNQSVAGLVADYVGMSGPSVEYKVDTAGKIYSKWTLDTKDMSKDGHWVIARRRRYG